ncbi:DNA-deoxyinosine glycosylase [Solimonas sp. K1W22B-7]|uniref:DNA-deoxyinosine glycosylase n=1 Tax=Solimonas sp. K1W22B-7 TaxID=2303331 RepID=UPI001F094000|nr:DNA-deoxyinosine glycosylase [Solimonas sp. K1W22B-7]
MLFQTFDEQNAPSAYPTIAMSMVQSFAPVADERSTILILGSMPGAASLREEQYYAHPRNQFWWLMGELIGAGPDLPYARRMALLRQHGIAMWDVLARCERPGSLDSSIVEESIVANDFGLFYRRHPKIWRVFFNGSKAQSSYQQYVMPLLDVSDAHIEYQRLPSTSPAHASRPAADKLEAWRAVIGK